MKHLFKKGNQASKGRVPWNKGLKGWKPNWTKEQLRKMSERMMGNQFAKGRISWNEGKTYTYEELYGDRANKIKEKMSRARKGKITWNKGKKCPQLSKALKEWNEKNPDARRGENNPCWKNGVSKFPYSFSFNEELKVKIRKRDNYECQLCGIKEINLNNYHKKIPIHHIDYNKENSDEGNFITLCLSCNQRANFNRNKWSFLFDALNEIRLTR